MSSIASRYPTCHRRHMRRFSCHVQELFKEKHYKDLDGGILEGFGRLLKFDLRIYVYPTLDTKTGKVITAENVKV